MNNPVISDAQTWYENEYPGNPVSGSTSILGLKSTGNGPVDFTQKIKPDWKHFANYKRLGKDVIEMPIDPKYNMGAEFKNMTAGTVYSDKKYNRTSFLLLKQDGVYKAYVMMIMANPFYVNNDLSKLDHNTYQKHDADFTGLVLYFTPKGRFLGSYTYASGQLITPATSQAADQVQSTTGADSKATNQVAVQSDCLDWYLITTYDDGSRDAVYLGTTCNTSCQSTKGDGCGSGAGSPNGGGGPPASLPPATCGGGSGGGGNINQSLNTIRLAFVDNGMPPPTDPCSAPSDDTIITLKLSNLPPNHTTDTQKANMCFFKTIEWLSGYFGGNVNYFEAYTYYGAYYQLSTTDFDQITQTGPLLPADVTGYLSHYFSVLHADPGIDIQQQINLGYPMMAAIVFSDGTGHEVMLTGYNNTTGQIQYFDPARGVYDFQPATSFANIYIIYNKS